MVLRRAGGRSTPIFEQRKTWAVFLGLGLTRKRFFQQDDRMQRIHRKRTVCCLMSHKTFQPHQMTNNSFSELFDSLAPTRLALWANLGLAFLKGSQLSRWCPLIHCVHSSGVAFGNLSPFGRLWLIPLGSGSKKRVSYTHDSGAGDACLQRTPTRPDQRTSATLLFRRR